MTETPADAITLVRTDGVVLARTAAEAMPDLPPNIPLRRAMQEGQAAGTYSITSPLDGNERLVSYRKVGEYPMYVSFALSYSAIWSTWRRNMLPYAGVCLLAAGLLLAAAVLVRRRLRREQFVTEQYVLETARRETAEQASRAKDEFLAALSHELRNPLASISNSAELLKRLHGEHGASGAALGIMGRQVAHLKRLLDDLLDVARINHGKLAIEVTAVDLTRMARTVAADMSAAGRPDIPVSGEAVMVAADPARLRQMIENLLDNARKYGGEQVRVTTRADGGFAELAVADNGAGIDPELLPHLFEPFVQGRQTIERAKGGLGLGLALVNKLALLHGGKLSVRSGAGGSVFTIRLPLAAAADAGAAVTPPVEAARPARRIMLVEDQPDARASLEAVLKAEGHEVQTAADGSEALERLRSFRPEVILIDIGLPGMNGYALAREIGSLPGQRATLIALTGYGQPEDRAQSRQAGFAAHLIKPVSYAELERCLQDAGAS
jgi:signal transduction histidine kinase/CheY-like chemotaxis protein